MSWALFQQTARARPFWLATASGVALAACPVMAQTSEESTPTEAAAGTPDLQTPDVVPTTSDAPDTASEQQIGFAADNLNYDGDSEVVVARSEEHTSELQSLMRISYAVFCLKKKNTTNN